MRKKLTREEVHTIVAMARKGMVLADLGRRYGVSRQRINQIVHREIPGYDGRVAARERSRITKTCPVCGKSFVVQKSAQRKWCSLACRKVGYRRNLPPEVLRMRRRAYELRAGGMKWQEVCEELGLKHNAEAVRRARRHAEDTGLAWPIPVR